MKEFREAVGSQNKYDVLFSVHDTKYRTEKSSLPGLTFDTEGYVSSDGSPSGLTSVETLNYDVRSTFDRKSYEELSGDGSEVVVITISNEIMAYINDYIDGSNINRITRRQFKNLLTEALHVEFHEINAHAMNYFKPPFIKKSNKKAHEDYQGEDSDVSPGINKILGNKKYLKTKSYRDAVEAKKIVDDAEEEGLYD